MDVRAIILVAPPAEAAAPEAFAGVPLGLLDILGRPVYMRIAERLKRFGITSVAVVTGAGSALSLARPHSDDPIAGAQVSSSHPWRAAEKAFAEHSEAGAEIVLVLRVGAYTDLDFDEFIQFHLDQHSRVTTVCTPDGAPLDIAAIASSRRNDAAFLFRHRLRHFRTPASQYVFRGYVNRLLVLSDLRRLACDAFIFRAQIPPAGAEIRPGVWVAPGARVHRGARILAPAFIGAQAKVRAAAVVTRGSVIEHHAVVDCGTVVENSTILPYTCVGAGLDICHSVVGFRRVLHLRRGVETDIMDTRLIDTVSPQASLRALRQAVSLATFLPAQLVRGMLAKSHRKSPVQLPAAVQGPSPARTPAPGTLPPAEAAEFPASLVVARRYGDQ